MPATDSIQVRRALLSVSDKTNVIDFAQGLYDLGVQLVSTGGTFRALQDAGLPAIEVSSVTEFPEMMDGRVKTLHPKIFGGILNRKNNRDDEDEILKYQIPKINIVIVDLYPFQETVDSGASINDIIEKIDIGGIALIRAAAKNYESVICVSNSNMYTTFLNLLSKN